MTDDQLEQLVMKIGNFNVWVKDQHGRHYYGNSDDLHRALSPKEDARIFPCYDQHGESWALWPNQIKEYGKL